MTTTESDGSAVVTEPTAPEIETSLADPKDPNQRVRLTLERKPPPPLGGSVGAEPEHENGAKAPIQRLNPEVNLPPKGEPCTNPNGSGQRHGGQDLSAFAGRELVELSAPDFPASAPPLIEELCTSFIELSVTASTKVTSFAAHPLFAPTLYAFSVIVALEWRPSRATIEQLMHAFKGASNTLYDSTNGAMVFGQVVFVGPEHMASADIQIMASNRFHPRSSVNGLHEQAKFSPIRLGRGVWMKGSHALLPWSESIAYRAIAHEWAHYALGLRDEYIDDARTVAPALNNRNRLVDDPDWGTVIVVPRIKLSVETLMETLEASELVPLQRHPSLAQELRDRIFNEIERRYPGAVAALSQANPGPYSFPGPLPQFYTIEGLEIDGTNSQETDIGVAALQDLAHCWLYSLSRKDDGLHIIAQGSLDRRARTSSVNGARLGGAPFQLLGAMPQDELIAIGVDLRGDEKQQGTCVVRRGAIPDEGPASAPMFDTSTEQEEDEPPVISVIPLTQKAALNNLDVHVRVAATSKPDAVWLGEPGDPMQRLGKVNEQLYALPVNHKISQLDGIVLLEWGETSRWVGEYSHGGNPPTTVRRRGAPLNAGSSDGNLMIFCGVGEPPDSGDDVYNNLIVTTRNYGGFERNGPGTPASYLFSVAANRALDYARLRPTIVMYYDDKVLDDDRELAICRYDERSGAWERLPTYLPGGAFYAATPINRDTAPNLVKRDPHQGLHLEHYRLFLIPRGQHGAT